MALIYFHHDKSKMIKKSSKAYYSHLRRVKTALYASLAFNVLILLMYIIKSI